MPTSNNSLTTMLPPQRCRAQVQAGLRPLRELRSRLVKQQNENKLRRHGSQPE